MTKDEILSNVKALNFPEGSYIVFGGCVLVAHGIRETEDVDVLVSADLFKKCVEDGWEVKPWNKPGKAGKAWLTRGNAELYSEIMMTGVNLKIEDLAGDIELIEGVPFLSLQKQLVLKKEYLSLYNRPKDVRDIELINSYLARTSTDIVVP